MKNLVSALSISLLVLGLAAGVGAQTRPSTHSNTKATDSSTKKTDSSTTKTDDADRPAWSPDARAVETSKLVGTKVQTLDGKNVATIDQLLINQTDGKVTHAVLGTGGVLGMGQTKLVLKWSDLKVQRDPDDAERWIVVVDQAKLDAAPRFEARREGDNPPAASPSSTPPAARPKASAPAKKY